MFTNYGDEIYSVNKTLVDIIGYIDLTLILKAK